ncbi:hypothetical protein Tco_1386770 [Tanacetum coccineum]
MSSITAQQTKLDLELVSKEIRIDIGKCNGRIPRGLTPREPTFQVVLDAIALTPCYPTFLITADVPEGREFDPLPSEEDTVSFLRELGHTGEIISPNDVVVDQMHQPWRTFAALINQSLSGKTSDFIYQIENRVYKKQENMYYPRFAKVIIHHFLIQEKTLSWRNKIRMHTSNDDYLINSLRFVSTKESSQIYGAILPECLTSPAIKESKAYKTYIGYAIGEVPPKIARKFKKASPTKKDSDLVLVDEELVTKGKRVKRSVKKSSTKPATTIVIRETLVKTKSIGKEKVDVSRGKGIDLLSEVALAEKVHLKEVRKKSLRDFHKTHPSGSGTVAEKPLNYEKITPTVTSEGTGDKPGVPDVTEDDSTESESDEEQESDDSEQEDESNDDNQEEEEVDQENESEDDEIESTDVEMIDAQQGNENLETTQEQVVEDAHVTISTVTKKTEVLATIQHEVPNTQTTTLLPILVSVFTTIPQSLHTFTPPPLVSTPTPPPTTKATNPLSTLLDFALVFRFNNRITALEKEVTELKKDPLHTQSLSWQVKDQRSQILPKEVSNFAPPVIKRLIKESHDEVTLAKVSYQPQSTYEAASTLTEFELKKILLDKIEKNKDKDEDPSVGSDRGLKKRKLSKDAEPTTWLKKKDSTSSSSKGTKSQPKSSRKSVQSKEPVFEVADSDLPQDQEGNLGDNEDEPKNKTASRRNWFKKPTPPQEPTNPD